MWWLLSKGLCWHPCSQNGMYGWLGGYIRYMNYEKHVFPGKPGKVHKFENISKVGLFQQMYCHWMGFFVCLFVFYI